jgi:hypothetical protein
MWNKVECTIKLQRGEYMKKCFVSTIVAFLLVFLLIAPTVSEAEKTIRVYIDDEELKFSVPPFVEKGVTFVPFRTIFEKLGLSVGWDDKTHSITGSNTKVGITLKIGDVNAIINNKVVKLSAPPISIQGVTFVPLRFIGEITGNEVNWDSTERLVQINVKNRKIETREEIENYLNNNYSIIDTKLARVSFNIKVYENDNINFSPDYYINFYYDPLLYERIFNRYENSIKYAETGKQDAELSRQQIIDFIEKAAKDVIEKVPNKKFKGNTEYFWYRYPHIKEGKHTIVKHSWVNYEPITPIDRDHVYSLTFNLLTYKEVKISNFTWMPELDYSYYDDPLK